MERGGGGRREGAAAPALAAAAAARPPRLSRIVRDVATELDVPFVDPNVPTQLQRLLVAAAGAPEVLAYVLARVRPPPEGEDEDEDDKPVPQPEAVFEAAAASWGAPDAALDVVLRSTWGGAAWRLMSPRGRAGVLAAAFKGRHAAAAVRFLLARPPGEAAATLTASVQPLVAALHLHGAATAAALLAHPAADALVYGPALATAFGQLERRLAWRLGRALASAGALRRADLLKELLGMAARERAHRRTRNWRLLFWGAALHFRMVAFRDRFWAPEGCGGTAAIARLRAAARQAAMEQEAEEGQGNGNTVKATAKAGAAPAARSGGNVDCKHDPRGTPRE